MPTNRLSSAEIEQIVRVLHAHGVARAALFGSFARQSAGEGSDIDLLVEFTGAKGLLDVAAIELELSDLLGRPVEIVTYRALNPRIRDQVLREQVSIL
jgi:predicted nucleotidyltransferase